MPNTYGAWLYISIIIYSLSLYRPLSIHFCLPSHLSLSLSLSLSLYLFLAQFPSRFLPNIEVLHVAGVLQPSLLSGKWSWAE